MTQEIVYKEKEIFTSYWFESIKKRLLRNFQVLKLEVEENSVKLQRDKN